MFERFEEAKRPRRGWRFATIVVSALAHAGLAVVAVVWSFWHVEKVKTKGVVIVDVGRPQIPVALGTPEAPPAPKLVKPKLPKVTATTQPRTTQPAETPDEPAGEPAVGDSPGQGDPTGTPGGDPTAPPGPPGDGNGQPPVPPPPPQIVEARVLEAQRVAGERNILLPGGVKQVMQSRGITQTVAMVRLCLDESGVPSSIRVVKSTGFPEADANIQREMQAWRYRPLLVNGRATAVCTAITVINKLN